MAATSCSAAPARTISCSAESPLNAPTPAQITHVADYSAAQGDTFDFSAITSAFHNSGVSDSLVVRAVEDASGKFATLQVDHIDPMGHAVRSELGQRRADSTVRIPAMP